MNKFKILLVVMVLAAITLPSQTGPEPIISPGVTGAGSGIFPPATTLLGIPLSGLTFGNGVFLSEDGTAAGQFESTLLGTSVLGQEVEIVVEGEVTQWAANGDGSVTMSGAASIEVGDGAPPSTGVPFSVTVMPDRLSLILDSITLPAATLVRGSITIE